MAETRSEQCEQNKIDYDILGLFNDFGTVPESPLDQCVHFYDESRSINLDNLANLLETDPEFGSINGCGDGEEFNVNDVAKEIFDMLSEMNIVVDSQGNMSFNKPSGSGRLEDCGTSCQSNDAQENPNGEKSAFAEPKVFNCRYCRKQFYSKMACRRHQLNHMKEFLRCPCCGMHLHSLDNVRRHFNYFHYCPTE